MLGRRVLRKAKAPIPAIRQSGASIGSQSMMTESVRNISSLTPALSGPSHRAAPPMETPVLPALHLVNESSPGKEEMTLLKMRRVEVGGVITVVSLPESDVVLGMESADPSVVETVLPSEVAVEGKPSEVVEVAIEEGRLG